MRGLVGLIGCFTLFSACSDVFGNTKTAVVERRWFFPFVSKYLWGELPAVASGLVMIADENGIAAFDAETGAPRWRSSMFSTPSGSSGDIVTANGLACTADLMAGSGCVDVASGHVAWTHGAEEAWTRQNAIDETSFFYGTKDHQVVSRDIRDGHLKWKTDVAPGAHYGTVVNGVAIRGGTLYASVGRWLNDNGFFSAGDLIALDKLTGKELWRITPDSEHTSLFTAPVFSGDIAIVSDVDSHVLRGIDVNTRSEVWQTHEGPDGYVTAERPPAVAGDTVFVGSTDTQVHAYDSRTGALRWRVFGNAGSLGSTALCGHVVLVVAWTSGPLIAVDRRTLRVSRPPVMIGDVELFSRIAVAGNMAYAVGMKGVYAFRCAA